MAPVSAPDLENGFIVNAISAPNCWTTEIQSVLVAEDTGERWYLSHECRQENVILAAVSTDRTMLQSENPYEFLTFTHNNRFYQIGSMDAPTTLPGMDGRQPPGMPTPHGSPNWASSPHCEDRPIRLLAFDEVLDGLRRRSLPPRALFLRLGLLHDGRRYTLYSPSHYVNFANDAVEQPAYVQPISGLVLMPGGDSVTYGYIVAALDGSGTRRVEFVAARYVDVYRWVAEREGIKPLAVMLGDLSRLAPCYTRVFDESRHVSGELAFYVYGQAAS